MEFVQLRRGGTGFDAVWQADSRLVREATVPMAAFAATTERIKVGSGVVDCWTRNPARLAGTFSTLDDLAPGPVILRHRRVVGSAGAARSASTAHAPLHGDARGRHRACARLLANETVTFDGDYVHLDGVELDYVYQERRPKDVPIYIGATGMQMMELTGEIADGVVLNYLVVAGVQRATPSRRLDRGAAKAGRTLDDIDRPQLVVCSRATRTATPRSTCARLLVTQYLGQQPHIMKASGVPQALLDEIGEVLTWPATHEQVVAAIQARARRRRADDHRVGHARRGRAKVAEYVADGCTCPILYPLGDDVRPMIDAFATP